MKKERFYYGEQLSLSDLEILLDKHNRIIGTGTISNRKSLPRVTVCGIWDTETNTMVFGAARCASKDSFEKSIGKELARKRANESPMRTVTITPSEKVSDVFLENARGIEFEIMQMGYPIKL